MTDLTRRGFLKLAALSSAAAAVPAILVPERRIWQVGATLSPGHSIFTSSIAQALKEMLDRVVDEAAADGERYTDASVRNIRAQLANGTRMTFGPDGWGPGGEWSLAKQSEADWKPYVSDDPTVIVVPPYHKETFTPEDEAHMRELSKHAVASGMTISGPMVDLSKATSGFKREYQTQWYLRPEAAKKLTWVRQTILADA